MTYCFTIWLPRVIGVNEKYVVLHNTHTIQYIILHSSIKIIRYFIRWSTYIVVTATAVSIITTLQDRVGGPSVTCKWAGRLLPRRISEKNVVSFIEIPCEIWCEQKNANILCITIKWFSLHFNDNSTFICPNTGSVEWISFISCS